MHVARDKGNVAKAILFVFAQYGFRKTSMEEIGRAANLSRQSIYNKFGSKKNCYTWATNAYLDEMYGRIFAVLNSNTITPNLALSSVFYDLVGESIDLVSNQYGTEVFRGAIDASYASEQDWPLRFRARLGDFLYRHHLAKSSEMGKVKAFALIAASKGLILEYRDREKAKADMMIIVKGIIPELLH